MSSSRQRSRWLLLIHQLPAEPAYLRVKVGRRLLRVGAVALKNSVYLLPALDACREDFSWIRREIVDEGGDASVFEAATVEGLTNGDIERMFGDARKKEYDELTREVATFAGGGTVEKPHERQAALSVLARLDEQLSVLERIDFFPSGHAEMVRDRLAAVRATLEQRAGRRGGAAAADTLQVADFQGRTWVTRAGVKIDRVACAWLIRRFIDKTAKFRFVDPSDYRPRGKELRFDMPEGEFTHEGDLCSFEVLCRRFALVEPGLVRLAEIVHDLDLKDGRYLHPETEGVRAFMDGMTAQHTRDEARIEAASTLLDALVQAGAKDAVPKKKSARRGGKDGRSQGRSS